MNQVQRNSLFLMLYCFTLALLPSSDAVTVPTIVLMVIGFFAGLLFASES